MHSEGRWEEATVGYPHVERQGGTIDVLQAEEPLPEHNRDHALSGNYVGYRECHLSPDWLLIYKVEGGTLILVRTGSHSELFR